MAKGLRSSVKKSNRSKLRSRVFGPVEAARNERLSAKLLELAQQPKPERPQKSEMDVDSEAAANAAPEDKEDEYPKDMEVDDTASTISRRPNSKKRRVSKKEKAQARKKPRNQISFPKSRGKGALKPHSESRIRKRRS